MCPVAGSQGEELSTSLSPSPPQEPAENDVLLIQTHHQLHSFPRHVTRELYHLSDLHFHLPASVTPPAFMTPPQISVIRFSVFLLQIPVLVPWKAAESTTLLSDKRSVGCDEELL